MDFTDSFFILLIMVFYIVLYGLKALSSIFNINIKGYVLLSSLLLYAIWYPPGLIVLFYTIIVTYIYSLYLHDNKTKRVLTGGIIMLLLPLLGFKYLVFLLSIFSEKTYHSNQWILPLGISFYVFTAIGYLVDLKKGTAQRRLNLREVSLLISFWPHLAAGPILRESFVSNTRYYIKKLNRSTLLTGLFLIVCGAAKKIFIADNLSFYVNHNIDMGIGQMNFLHAWVTILGFGGQIYADFSGYSEMAIGFALLIGFKLPANFNYPYAAKNITSFWRRWHISLSSWFRDYLYIPLGGRTQQTFYSIITVLIVFLVSGLWHGAAWNFLFWGAIHACFLIIQRKWKSINLKIPTFLSWLLTFFAVHWAWVFFRLDTQQAMEMSSIMFLFKEYEGNANLMDEFYMLPIVGLLLFVLLDHVFKYYTVTKENEIKMFDRHSILTIYFYASLMTLLMSLLGGQTAPFIYFEF